MLNKFWLLVISWLLIVIVAPVFQQGLFIDGLLYKTVATNFYHSETGFWNMKFNDISMNPFYEQPPLFFFVTGTLYHLFGNSFLADKFVTVLFLGFSVFMIDRICVLLFTKRIFSLVTIFLLLLIPIVCWTYVNQVIETLVLPLSLLGCYCFFKFRQTEKPVSKIICVAGFSLTIILLFLTKGFQSCFVITLPFLFALFFRGKSSWIFAVVSSVLVAIKLYVLLFVYEPSSLWFANYLQKRLLASMNGVGATAPYRAEIIVRAFTELIGPLLFILIAWLFSRNKAEASNSGKNKKLGFVFLLLALFGSLPFAVTLEQRGFYLVPSFPFFILALNLIFFPQLNFVFQKINNFISTRVNVIFPILLLLGALAYVFLSPGLYKRDENLLKDLVLIRQHVPIGDTISIDGDSWNDTALQAYLYMQHKTNVEGNYNHRFYIHDRSHETIPNTDYKKVEIPTLQYDLFVKK